MPQSAKQLIIQWLAARDRFGRPLSYTDIGVKVRHSREYVRQIALLLGETGRQRQIEIRQHMPCKPKAFPYGRRFVAMVNHWLSAISCRYCGCCHRIWPSVKMYKKKPNRCPECSRAMLRRWYHTEHGKAKSKAWREANREHTREYGRRYYQRKCEQIRKAESNAPETR